MEHQDNKGADNRAKSSGQKNAAQLILRGVIAGYLIYLGATLIRDQIRGVATISPTVIWIFGPLFLIAGLGFGFYTWKQWKVGQAEAPKDPEDSASGK